MFLISQVYLERYRSSCFVQDPYNRQCLAYRVKNDLATSISDFLEFNNEYIKILGIIDK